VLVTVAFGLVVRVGAQPPRQAPPPPDDSPVFRSGVTLVTTDVIPRDANGRFLPDLTKDDFVVYEDGQAQEIASLVLVHGGRVFNQLAPPAPVQEGIVLPSSAPMDDAAGRVFVLFIDDMHLSVTDTPKINKVLHQVAETLIHEGDMFGIISSGRSNINVQMTRDRKLLYAAIDDVVGEGLSPRDMVTAIQANSTQMENRWRAQQTFKTARATVDNLAEVRNRRKAFIYVSGGYDFDPFEDARVMALVRSMDRSGLLTGEDDMTLPDINDPDRGRFDEVISRGETFSEAELHLEVLQLTEAANRANVSFYTVDPRGLGSAADLNFDVRELEWNEYVSNQRNSLRALAELTGGIAVVNRNDFDDAFREIDAETSDYYILGFYSGNPDPTHHTRRLRVQVARDGIEVQSRSHYTIPAQSELPPR